MKKVKMSNIIKFFKKNKILIFCIVVIVILIVLILLRNTILNLVNNNLIENMDGEEQLYTLNNIDNITIVNKELKNFPYNSNSNTSISFDLKIEDLSNNETYDFCLIRLINNNSGNFISLDIEHNTKDTLYILQNNTSDNSSNIYPSNTTLQEISKSLSSLRYTTLQKTNIDSNINLKLILNSSNIKVIINDKCIEDIKFSGVNRIKIADNLIQVRDNESILTNVIGDNNISISKPMIDAGIIDEYDCTNINVRFEDLTGMFKTNSIQEENNSGEGNIPNGEGNIPNEEGNIPNEEGNIPNEEGNIPNEEENEKRPNTCSHTMNRCSPIVNVSYYTNNYTNSNKTSDTDTLNSIQPVVVADNSSLAPVQDEKEYGITPNYIYNGSSDLNDLNDKYIDNILNQKSDYCPVIIGNANGYGEFKSLDN